MVCSEGRYPFAQTWNLVSQSDGPQLVTASVGFGLLPERGHLLKHLRMAD